MAYRNFEQFDQSSVKQVNPLEGIGESVARGLALAERRRANDQANKLAKLKADNDAYDDALAKLDPGKTWEVKKKEMAAKVNEAANKLAAAQAAGKPFDPMLKQQLIGDLKAEAAKHNQLEAESKLVDEGIKSLPSYYNKDKLTAKHNEYILNTPTAEMDFKSLSDKQLNVVDNEDFINVPAFMSAYNEKAGSNDISLTTSGDKGYTTTSTTQGSTTNRFVKTTFDTNGQAIYSIPKENATALVEDIYQFDKNYKTRQLKAGERVIDSAVKQYVAAAGGSYEELTALYKSGKLDGATSQKIANYLPRNINGTTPGEIAAELTLKEYQENMKTKAQFNTSVKFDRAGYRADQKEKNDKADKKSAEKTLEYTPNRTFTSIIGTNNERAETYTPLEVGIAVKGKDVEIKAANLGRFYDYDSGKWIETKNSKLDISNRNVVVGTGKLVVKNKKTGKYIQAANEAELLSKIKNHSDPENLEADYWVELTDNKTANGAMSSQANPKTYGTYASEIAPQLKARGIDLVRDIPEDKKQHLDKIQSAVSQARNGKPTQLSGQVNMASLQTGKTYNYNGKVYVWNGNKLIPQ